MRLDRAGAASVGDAGPSALQRRGIESRVGDGLLGGRERVHGDVAHGAGRLAGPRGGTGEARDGPEMRVEPLVPFQRRQRLHAVLELAKPRERARHVLPERAHDSHSCHDNPSHVCFSVSNSLSRQGQSTPPSLIAFSRGYYTKFRTWDFAKRHDAATGRKGRPRRTRKRTRARAPRRRSPAPCPSPISPCRKDPRPRSRARATVGTPSCQSPRP